MQEKVEGIAVNQKTTTELRPYGVKTQRVDFEAGQ